MRVLGIDYGDRRIGLALSDKLLLTGQSLGSYQRQNKRADKLYFQQLIEKHDISKVVIGLPLLMNGTRGIQAQKTQDFAQWLEDALKLPTILWDERLTTQQALRVLTMHNVKGKQKKKFKDQISASIILSSYLESERRKSNVR